MGVSVAAAPFVVAGVGGYPEAAVLSLHFPN